MAEAEGAGRARGRARGRPATGPGHPVESEGGNGNGNGNGAAQRGRGGFRPLRTIPAGVKTTSGEGGTVVRLLSNYFKLLTPDNIVVYDYHVSFEPQVESVKMRRAFLWEQRASLGDSFVFDGVANMKSTKCLDEESTFTGTRRTDGVLITITVKRTGEIPWSSPEMLRLYNTMVRRNMTFLKYVIIGRHYFDPTVKHNIPEHKIQIWPGVQTAINQHDAGMLMGVDTVHKIVRAETVYEALQTILKQDRAGFRDNARRELSGQILMTTYNNRNYKIDDIAFDKNPLWEFERRDGKITIKDYYKQQYSIDIRDEKQPLLLCKPSGVGARRDGQEPQQVLLVPELCTLTGLTDAMANNFDLKKQMINLTRADPNRRVGNLFKFIRDMTGNEDVKREMGAWSLKFEPAPLELTGRVLANERIFMQGDNEQNASSFDQKSGDFSKEIRGKGMRVPPPKCDKWIILCTQRDQSIVDDFAQTLNKVCGPLGFILGRPQVRPLENDRTSTFVNACKAIPKECQMVVCIVPNNNKERYDSIKKTFCCDQPMPSQVVLFKTLSKKPMLMSVCTKLGIQMACKLGAEAWVLHIPPKNVMVVGYDTYHDSSMKNKSVGGFVCSVNPTLSKWYSRVAYHENHEEMSNNFAINFTHGLKRYHEVNKVLPERVIIYRDGVSEGQIAYVYDFELKQIKESINKLGPVAQNIKMAFVIVTKRVNARFFLRTGERQAENPIPGTIIDNTVTRLERYDFFLVSQSVRQGTVNPTMYNIIEDETNWKPSHHQQLAYKLTHLYYNWPGTVRVPAPCQYAHKLAYLTGVSLHREPHGSLADQLFFL